MDLCSDRVMKRDEIQYSEFTETNITLQHYIYGADRSPLRHATIRSSAVNNADWFHFIRKAVRLFRLPLKSKFPPESKEKKDDDDAK